MYGRINFMICLIAVLVLSSGVQVSFGQTAKTRTKPLTKTKSKIVTQKDKSTPEIPPNNSTITFDHEQFDYGVVPRGEQVTHHFPVKNTGTDTLTITRIKPGCGCTTTRKSSIVLPPGESSLIDITYRSSKSARSGHKVTKRIRIESTDSQKPTLQLSISARTDTADCMLRCRPEMVDLGEVLIGKDDKFEVEITNIDSLKSEIMVVSEPTSEFIKKFKIKKDKLKSDQKTKIEFQLQDNIPPGEFKTALTIEANNDSKSRISIPIHGKIVESFSEKKTSKAGQEMSSSAVSGHPKVSTVDDSDLK